MGGKGRPRSRSSAREPSHSRPRSGGRGADQEVACGSLSPSLGLRVASAQTKGVRMRPGAQTTESDGRMATAWRPSCGSDRAGRLVPVKTRSALPPHSTRSAWRLRAAFEREGASRRLPRCARRRRARCVVVSSPAIPGSCLAAAMSIPSSWLGWGLAVVIPTWGGHHCRKSTPAIGLRRAFSPRRLTAAHTPRRDGLTKGRFGRLGPPASARCREDPALRSFRLSLESPLRHPLTFGKGVFRRECRRSRRRARGPSWLAVAAASARIQVARSAHSMTGPALAAGLQIRRSRTSPANRPSTPKLRLAARGRAASASE